MDSQVGDEYCIDDARLKALLIQTEGLEVELPSLHELQEILRCAGLLAGLPACVNEHW